MDDLPPPSGDDVLFVTASVDAPTRDLARKAARKLVPRVVIGKPAIRTEKNDDGFSGVMSAMVPRTQEGA